MSEKKQMILVETEEPKNLDDGNLQEGNSPLCLPASDAPDLQTEDNGRGPFNVYVDKIRSYFGRKPTSPPCPPASDAPDLLESFDAKSVAPSEAKSEAKSLAPSEAKSLATGVTTEEAKSEAESLATSEAKSLAPSEAKSVAPSEAPSSIVTAEHPYGNKRMTLVHLRQIDGNCYKVTEDVNPTADYRFRKVETEMDDPEIQQFNSDWIEFWQPEITRKQIENIHKKIK